jgi:hypothetical protein
MTKPLYRVQRQDGGWVYDANGTPSEIFRTREEARKAARLAAQSRIEDEPSKRRRLPAPDAEA